MIFYTFKYRHCPFPAMEQTVTYSTGNRRKPKTPLRWWVLLPIALILSGWWLSTSADLPALEERLAPQVQNAIRQSVIQKVQQEYPHLNQQELQALAQQRVQEVLYSKQAKTLTDTAVNEYKQFFQDNGQPYLLSYDAYYYFRYAHNLVDHGHPGETLKNGKPHDTLRRAPHGVPATTTLLPLVSAYWHRIATTFTGASILATVFYLPVFLGLISITLLYFLTRKLFNNEIAFYAAILFAVHPAVYKQNMAGFADTTALVMPLSLAFLYSTLWVVEGTNRQRLIAAGSALLLLALLKHTWTGWFFALGIAAAYSLVHAAHVALKNNARATLAISALIGTAIILYLHTAGYLHRLLIKLQYIDAGLQSAVKELARPAFPNIIANLGGTLFVLLLATALTWFVIHTYKNRTPRALFLLTWLAIFIPTLHITRFAFFIAPPAAILTAWLLKKIRIGLAKLTASLYISKQRTASLAFVFILPLAVGTTMMDTNNARLPPLHDGIANTGEWLQRNTPPDAIINTWWDLGYAWQYAAQRPTILDATADTSAQYFAKALTTANSTHARNLIRMLDCGNDRAYGRYNKELSSDILDTVIRQTKKQTAKTLAARDALHLLNFTHCTPPDAYVIVDKTMLNSIGTIGAIAEWQEGEPFSIPTGTLTRTTPCNSVNATTLNCRNYLVDLQPLHAQRDHATPHSVILHQNGTTTERVYDKGANALIIYQENNNYFSFLITPKYRNSLLVRLYANGNTTHFTHAHEETLPERVMTWQVNWHSTQEPAQPSARP